MCTKYEKHANDILIFRKSELKSNDMLIMVTENYSTFAFNSTIKYNNLMKHHLVSVFITKHDNNVNDEVKPRWYWVILSYVPLN